MITTPTNLRLYCTKHDVNLKNTGSEQIFYPTNSPPQEDEEGWWLFDMSEYGCPIGDLESEEDCSEYHEVQVK